MTGLRPDERATSQAADKRDFAADSRDDKAAERDNAADLRDAIADERDRIADEREAELEELEQRLIARASELGIVQMPTADEVENAESRRIQAARLREAANLARQDRKVERELEEGAREDVRKRLDSAPEP